MYLKKEKGKKHRGKKNFNFTLTCKNINQENNKLRMLCYRMLAIPILDTLL